MRLLRTALSAFAALLAAGCNSAEPFMHVPVGSTPRPLPPQVRPTIPPGSATSAAATEAVLLEVVQKFCLAGVEGHQSDAALAQTVNGIVVSDPWQDDRLMLDTPP